MSGFFPVDRGIFTSSIWLTGSAEEKVLWIWLLGNRSDDGVVRHRELAISFGAGLSRPVVEALLVKFSRPDSDSRTKDNDGRRIDRTDEGFVRILNHELYYSKDYSTPRWRRWNERKGLSCPPTVGQRLNLLENVGPTKDTDKDKDTDTTETTEGLPAAAPAELPETAPEIPKPERKPDPAVAFVESFNLTFGRRCALTPGIRKRAQVRARDYEPWQLAALPVLVLAQGMPDDMRRNIGPDVLLRDGSRPRTSNGQTTGATDWIERAFLRADQTTLSPRLSDVARRLDVLDRLKALGVREAQQ